MFASHSRLSVFFCFALSLLLVVPGCGDKENKEVNSSASTTSDSTTTDDSTNGSSSDAAAPSNESNNKPPAKQPPATPSNSVAHPYITDDFQAAVVIHPRKIYESALLQNLMKTEQVKEVIDDELIEQMNRELKLDVRELQRYSLLIKNLPNGPHEEPAVAMVLEFFHGADHGKLIQQLTNGLTSQQQGGMKWYIPDDTVNNPVVCEVNDKTIVIGTPLDLVKQVVSAPAAKSPLNTRLVELDYSNQHFVAVGSRDIIPAALLAEMQRGLSNEELPPTLSEITDLIGQLKSASAVLSLSPDLNVKLSIETTSEENTTKLTTMVNDSLTMAKTALGAIALIPPREMPESFKPVIQEALKILAKIKLEQSGTQLDVAMSVPEATLASLQGPLFEAMESAGSAAHRLQNMNNFKQIGLAIHNYHETYAQFPVGEGGDIKYKDGKRLLSWRVHLLPFLDHEALYKQFKLDEPWDSPHNVRLLDDIPPMFVDPNQSVVGHKTTFLAPVGPGSLLGETKKTRFADVLDGMSQTIMIVEVGLDKAVPWTKPSDLTYDLKDPVGSLGSIGDVFLAVFADGSVHQLKKTIKPTTLLQLFHRNDGNSINFNELRD